MKGQTELQIIGQQVDKLAKAKGTQKDKAISYQHKILQLLMQQKITTVINQSLGKQINELKTENQQKDKKLASSEKQFKALSAKYGKMENQWGEKAEDAETKVKLGEMRRLEAEEQRDQLTDHLEEQINKVELLQKENGVLKEELVTVRKESEAKQGKISQMEQNEAILKQKLQLSEKQLKQWQGKATINLKQLSKQKMINDQKQVLNSQLTAQHQSITLKAKELASTLQKLKLANIHLQSENKKRGQDCDGLNEKMRETQRELGVIKERKKQIEGELQMVEVEKQDLLAGYKKQEKEGKRVREQLKGCQEREGELEEELGLCKEKMKSLQKGLKNARREVSQLKQSLLTAQQTSGSEVARIKKWESAAKAQKQKIVNLEQQLSSKVQQLSTLRSQFDTLEKLKFQLGMQLEKASKEREVLSEMNVKSQQRRVLLQSDRQRVVGVHIREKDVLSRANFKLLQMVELKEKVVRQIIKCMSEGSEMGPIETVLGGDREAQELLGGPGRDKLTDPSQRIKVLQEWLSRR